MVLSGTGDTSPTDSLGVNSVQTDNFGVNSDSSAGNYITSPFGTSSTPAISFGTSSTGSVNIESKWPKLYQAARAFNQQEICNNIARTTKDRPDMIKRNAWGLNECLQDDFIQK